MENIDLNERTVELIIRKAYDEFNNEEDEELENLLSNDSKLKLFVESLLNNHERLIDFITLYTTENIKCDATKLQKAKDDFDAHIAKLKG